MRTNDVNVDEIVPKFKTLLEYAAAVLQTSDADDKVTVGDNFLQNVVWGVST